MGGNFPVHQGLGESRIVGFVVAIAAIAPQIDQDIALEFLTKLNGQTRGVYYGFGIIGIDMKYRRLNLPSHIRRIGGKTALRRRRRVPQLIVDDDVNGAAGFIALKLR